MNRTRLFRSVKGDYGLKGIYALLVLLFLAVAAFSLSGCSDSKEPSEGAEVGAEARGGVYPFTIEDDLGRQVTITEEPQRIVSLAPANTEILFAIGLGDKVVGVTDYCDYPIQAVDKEKVGDFYGPSVEKIVALEPDIIFATGGIQAEVVQQLEGLGQLVVALNPESLDEVMEAVEVTGKITGQLHEAEQVTVDMQRSIDRVQEATKAISEAQKPGVFVVIWFEDAKIFSAGQGSFVSDLVTLAGGRNLADAVKVEYPQYSREKLMEEDPEVIISTAHGYSTPEAVKEVLNMDSLQAVRNHRVYIIEDADLFSLPGPRLVQGLEMTAEFLHPEIFSE